MTVASFSSSFSPGSADMTPSRSNLESVALFTTSIIRTSDRKIANTAGRFTPIYVQKCGATDLAGGRSFLILIESKLLDRVGFPGTIRDLRVIEISARKHSSYHAHPSMLVYAFSHLYRNCLFQRHSGMWVQTKLALLRNQRMQCLSR
jgi:hypothetical protein